MAIVVLTDSQKELLRIDPGYQQEVKWGVLNKAVYWQGQNGISPPGGTTRWAKSRAYAATIINNPVTAEAASIINQFLILNKDIPCVDNTQPFSSTNVVTYLISNNSFDAMADGWFDQHIQTIPF